MKVMALSDSSIVEFVNLNTRRKIGRELRCLRKLKGMSGKDFGQLINVSQQQISRYENGICLINIDTLILLLHKLNVSPNDFFKNMLATIEQEVLLYESLCLL